MKNISIRRQKILLFVAFSLLALLVAAAADAQVMTNVGDTFYIKNNTVVEVKGGFTNTDNGSKKPYMYNDGILGVEGDWDAPADMIYLGTDTFMASGIGSQNIAGLSYYNLMVTNGGTKTMTSKSYIRHKLIISNGTLETYTDTVQLDSAASIIEDSANNAMGSVKMVKYLAKNTAYTFGNLGFDITTTSATPGMTSIVRVTGSGSIMHGLGASSVARFFDVTPQNDKNLKAQIRFHYYGTELNGITRPDLALYSSEDKGTTWKYSGFSARNPGSNDVENTGIDSFSRWTLAGNSTPLPVILMDFTANASNKDAKLFWQTASEINNDHFEIERSLNAHEWEKIGEEKGFGTTNEVHSYSMTDFNAGLLNSDVLYYRLKQVDYNGKSTYSDVRKVVFTSEASAENMKIWINNSEGQLFVSFQANTSRPATISIVDMQGKLIVKEGIVLKEGLNQFSSDVADLSKGIYSIILSDNSKVWTKKAVKY